MPFPIAKEIVYRRNTLQQVICQLRFPTILRVEAQMPAEYQELIRKTYPFFRERYETMEQVPLEIAHLVPEQLKEVFPSGHKYYEFKSEDDNWIITLTRDNIALTCTHYRRWRDFRSHFERPLNIFIDMYQPAFFSRIGLRYQNLIQRSEIGLDDAPWSTLLKPYISGPLGDSDIESSVTGVLQAMQIRLDDVAGEVRIQHGTVIENDTKEQCYLIDSDLFTENRTEITDVLQTLDRFNQKGTQLFQWFISDRLEQALGTSPIRP